MINPIPNRLQDIISFILIECINSKSRDELQREKRVIISRFISETYRSISLKQSHEVGSVETSDETERETFIDK